jgi:mannitol/fructose-specific phosphotransferase system IIA component (Ntr-type)
VNLVDLLTPETIAVGMTIEDRDEVFKALVSRLPVSTGAVRAEILDSVLAREELHTTGIGFGIAIPHGRASIEEPLLAAVGTSSVPVPYDSLDGQPIRIFILMVSRHDSTGPHVQALAQVAKLLGKEDFRARLLAASDPDEVIDLFRKEVGS